ncbi:SDR family NAD(P)-dependent oxidoreductase [Gammaproteobacteria bacterium]|jgi:NAD(P)-dependent dehydrogenase (short-subunit alcohol dehydrogenase family)|uniref:3-hydroxy-2-methylbutyryl-CoA dehydrogenase n=4 Tax=OM182 clade TaxID=745002 RepID=A0A0R2T783_9GAMM|nr:MAG: 3-hydroxy-2-methylbutyryl-CoA dehydrogenase [OM182 bacterium BACL3 MAG-120619-bin3]KRP29847.1 MAG: 3-hydroxy-2-methylbutyryl-CoA dehydrogenase [OM182 bacterium BACL3 MAG-120924-bin41]KRP38770.1 MAG: 3-hydroxy-2-methylbutyryl-CoA dehydrogenase [OM182 bacterium BACL3 MAG-120531-bin86]MBT3522299.1 SDR family NAD(P)-dependent oxidoreductase [Gammaproteobacteria bacterium]MDP4660079.1 SDR family NAD(P)-dependent oxidoreductase [OM182 bacterium]
MDLKNKTAFITGGASGLGLATAKNFIAAGANVMLYDLRADALEAAAASLGPAVAWHAGDVADEVGVSEAIAIAKEKFGTIHVNVNAAGIGGAARTVGKDGPMPLAKFEHIVRVNLVGTFNVLRLCAEVMQVNEPVTADGERGVIVNVASVAAFDGQTGQAGYAASKGGIVSMTLPIARDLSKRGVRIMTIAPGVFETPMMAGAPDAVREPLIAITQFPKRLGNPAEFAQEVAHIVNCGYLNGETIRLDSGIRMPA